MNNQTKEVIDDIKNVRNEALQNAKITLLEAFSPTYNTILNENKEEECIILPCQKKNENITSKESNDKLKKETNLPISQDIKKKSHFIDDFIFSLYRKKHSNRFSMKRRFQKLSNIKTDPTIARLKLKNDVIVNLTEIPHWYDIIRYKICGFEYEITKFK